MPIKATMQACQKLSHATILHWICNTVVEIHSLRAARTLLNLKTMKNNFGNPLYMKLEGCPLDVNLNFWVVLQNGLKESGLL